MLTNLEEVFLLPKEAAERGEAPPPPPSVDPADVEAVAQHERGRLAALKAEKEAQEVAAEAANTAPAPEAASVKGAAVEGGGDTVRVEVSETGVVKLSVLAAVAVEEQGATPTGMRFSIWHICS